MSMFVLTAVFVVTVALIGRVGPSRDLDARRAVAISAALGLLGLVLSLLRLLDRQQKGSLDAWNAAAPLVAFVAGLAVLGLLQARRGGRRS